MSIPLFIAGCSNNAGKDWPDGVEGSVEPEQGREEPISVRLEAIDMDEDELEEECIELSIEEVSEHIEAELDKELESVTVWHSTKEKSILVILRTTITYDGNMVGEPNVELNEVLNVTPESITVSTGDPVEFDCTWPVYVEHMLEKISG